MGRMALFLKEYRIDSDEEKHAIEIRVAEKNKAYVIIVGVIFLFIEVIYAVYDNFNVGDLYVETQYLYNIIHVCFFCSVAVMVALNVLWNHKTEEKYRVLNMITFCFEIAILVLSMTATILDSATLDYPDMLEYFVCLFTLASILYTHPIYFGMLSLIGSISATVLIDIFVENATRTVSLPFVMIFTLMSFLVAVSKRMILIRETKQTQVILKLKEEADQANDTKSKFLANTSHEIRTPLNAIIGMSAMQMRQELPGRAMEYARQIHAAGKGLLTIINDILDFSKIESGKMEIIPVEYDVMALVNELSSLVLVRIADKPVKLLFQINQTLSYRLFGDDIRIKQVLLNLATNAAKFTQKGTITIRIDYIRQQTSQQDNQILLKCSVEDTGIGMKVENIEKLFDSFSQLDMEKNRKIEGTGLGLSISKQLVTLMGGTIGVSSVYGEGSNFFFEIPQQIVTVKAKESKCESVGKTETVCDKYGEVLEKLSGQLDYESRANGNYLIPAAELMLCEEYLVMFQDRMSETHFTAKQAKILIVDDNLINLQVAEGLLEPYQIQIETAQSGQNALDMLAQSKYDLIFMDHMMPQMDGIETTEKIRQMDGDYYKEVPIIMLTANAMSGAREQYLAKGFQDFLSKPIEPEKLTEQLLRYLPKDKVVPASEESDNKNTDVTKQVNKGNPELIPDMSVLEKTFDVQAGINNVGSVKEYLKILRTFYMTLPPGLYELEESNRDGRIRDFTIKVHAMKSSARILGAGELSDMCACLEQYGLNEDKEEIDKRLPSLLLLARECISCMESIVSDAALQESKIKQRTNGETESSDNRELMSEQAFLTYLKQIKSMADDCNLDAAEQCLKELKEQPMNEKMLETSDWIGEALDVIEYEQCNEIIEQYINNI